MILNFVNYLHNINIIYIGTSKLTLGSETATLLLKSLIAVSYTVPIIVYHAKVGPAWYHCEITYSKDGMVKLTLIYMSYIINADCTCSHF